MKLWHLLSALVCFGSLGLAHASEYGPPMPVEDAQPVLLAQAAVSASGAAPLSPAPLAGPMDKHYLRFIDFGHVEQSVAALYSPSNRFPTAGVTDVCGVTHSTDDGSIIPQSLWKWLPPENFCAFEVGAGGQWNPQDHGNAVVDAGASVNVAPQVLGWTTAAITPSSPAWMQVYKGAVTSQAGSAVNLRLGVGEEAHVVNGGLIATNQMLPGSGIGDILNKNLVLKAGVAWKWGHSASAAPAAPAPAAPGK
jgi:hypothetical protein